ncbi:protein tipE [Sitodiplosis mosellana]|uniref:protein tipE n=1 Tax=Sitodiplosis mosellana TaxID=263140 RepID=UPI0024443344|nr:protein tipE [Sitodiplosis mosellana]
MTSTMISGSSEQLLEQQQQELRNRKLKELVPKKKPAQVKKVSWRERAAFYATSTLAFLSVTAGASLLFLVPLYVDPAISTLTSDFIENPTWCTTTRRDDVIGLMNCSWSSCREGCTSDLYRCTHIYVKYIIETSNETLFSNLSTAITASIDNDMQQARTLMQTASHTISNITDIVHSDEAILLVNIKGCGYPPTVMCKNFSDLYGEEGTVFPCYYSRTNRTLVMTAYNQADQWSMIINFFFVPFVITVISSMGLCFMHCDCSCQKERSPQQRQRQRERERCGERTADDRHFCRRPRLDNLSDSSISTRVDMLTPAVEVYKPPL